MMLLTASVPSQAISNNCRIVVHIENIPILTNRIYLAVFKDAKGYDEDKPYRLVVCPVHKKNMSVQVSLPKGTYSVKIFQDLNNNRKIDTVFGIPREPYGLSNNINGFPDWKKTKFYVNGTKIVKIKMRYRL